MDIFLQQQGRCRLIAVGDAFQNIYSWRGAVNGMLQLDWPEAKLSKSFRFGQAVGDIADAVLATDGVKQTAVKGFEILNTQCFDKWEVDASVFNKAYTMLFRTNGALIFEAVELMERGKRVNLEIDVSDFTKLLDSAIELKRGNLSKVKHENLIQFASWKECGDEAEVVQGELLRVYNMVENGSVYKILGVLSKHKNHREPDVILTTAHKSKGREWDLVILAEDFPSPYNKEGEWVGLQDMERNLLYVALTRAKLMLVYNDTVGEMIARCNIQNVDRLETDLDVERAIQELKDDWRQ